MRLFDVQGIEIDAPRARVFAFVADPQNLPRWARAFKKADDRRAELDTPAGAVEIRLRTTAEPQLGTVDWSLEFSDGTVALAQSRVTETTRGTSIYSFVLHAPPLPLEQIEGALDAQRSTLEKELLTLKSILENP